MLPDDKLRRLSSRGPFQGDPAGLGEWIHLAQGAASDGGTIVQLEGSELRVFPDMSIGDVWIDFDSNDPEVDPSFVTVKAQVVGGQESMAYRWCAAEVATKTAQISRLSTQRH